MNQSNTSHDHPCDDDPYDPRALWTIAQKKQGKAVRWHRAELALSGKLLGDRARIDMLGRRYFYELKTPVACGVSNTLVEAIAAVERIVRMAGK